MINEGITRIIILLSRSYFIKRYNFPTRSLIFEGKMLIIIIIGICSGEYFFPHSSIIEIHYYNSAEFNFENFHVCVFKQNNYLSFNISSSDGTLMHVPLGPSKIEEDPPSAPSLSWISLHPEKIQDSNNKKHSTINYFNII